VLVEGQTEEAFVTRILAPHLYGYGYLAVAAKLLGHAHSRKKRGGIRNWAATSLEILLHLKADVGVVVTTMVDYYGLPQGPPEDVRAWPGRSESGQQPVGTKRAETVEASLRESIATKLDAHLDARRFIPFVVLHEFESLLFSDCQAIAAQFQQVGLRDQLEAICQPYTTPEEINDSPQTHPSRRLIQLIPGYRKPIHGLEAAEAAGLATIRAHCPHFASWLDRLERIPVDGFP
jgi:hypothetical protein